MTFRFAVVSIFPDVVESYVRASILGRAGEHGLIDVSFFDPRDHATDRHRSVDDATFGGGAGGTFTAPDKVDIKTGRGNDQISMFFATIGHLKRGLTIPAGTIPVDSFAYGAIGESLLINADPAGPVPRDKLLSAAAR